MKINIVGFFQEMKETLYRFPVGIAMSVFLCGITWLSIGNFLEDDILLSSLALSSIVTFFLSIGVTLLSENNTDKKYLGDLGQVGSIIFGILFYLSIQYSGFENFENILLFILTFFCFFCFMFFAPFTKKIFSRKYSELSFYAFFVKISYTLFIASLLGGILSVLGAIAIGSIDLLFDINNFPDDIYGYWISFALSFVAPYFALSNIPNKNEIDDADILKNKFFTFVLRYVAIPFIYLYFFILYAYSIKVLLNFENWPKGEVSWLVIGFSIFGYLTYVYTYVFERENVLVHWFRKFFPLIVIPQIFMLFYAIYLRIVQYDITVNRYFVVVFGIWLLGISLYYILSQSKKLIFLPASLSIIILLISVGPWSVFSFPESRQYDRLLNNLTQANILQDGKIVPLPTGKEISAELSENIESGIRYVCDFSECEKIKTLFAKEIESYKKINPNNFDPYSSSRMTNSWEVENAVISTLKVGSEHRISTEILKNISFHTKSSIFPINIKGYESIIQIQSQKKPTESEFELILDIKTKKLKIFINNSLVEDIDISKNIDAIIAKNDNTYATELTNDELTFEISGKLYTIKLLITSFDTLNPKYVPTGDDEIQTYSSAQGYALIKKN